MRKFLIRLLCCFIPVAKWRRKVRSFDLPSRVLTRKLFELQYDKNGYFQAYDTCVRYGFAKEYLSYGEKKDGFWYNMYIKMQSKRGTVSTHNPARFINLIKSYTKNGYQKEKIFLYKNGLVLADGSHRLSLNLLFGYKYIYVYIIRSNNGYKYRDYGLDWFKNNGFTESELHEIKKMKAEIFKRYKLKEQKD